MSPKTFKKNEPTEHSILTKHTTKEGKGKSVSSTRSAMLQGKYNHNAND